MDAPGQVAIRKMQAVAQAMRTALRAAAEAYANGGGRGRPIVDQHFTAGNQARYGWAPLSREYFLEKSRGLAGRVRGGVAQLVGSRGSKLDKAAGFRSSTGSLSGEGSGVNLPMLVNSGTLRQAVAERQHPIRVSDDGNMVTISFANLPGYAPYLDTGTGKMPQRSPVQPGEQDIAEIKAVIRRHMDKAMGTQGSVPIGTPLAESGARGI